jgi:anthranilate phosphoribosyltransferase
MSQSFKEILETISEGIDLAPDAAENALQQIVAGNVSNEEVAAFLFGMRAKGESVNELTSFVRVMRNASITVDVDTAGAVDLCGTGGDSSGTFNISTAAMFVVAGAGVPVLKHGNRSVSSKCGSADVLEELGVVADLGKVGVKNVFNETGMAFMFAPNFHPAMKYVMPARKALGIRTFFNILGPLLNPADVKRQVVGAYSKDVARTMVQILGNLQTERAYTLNAQDGLDEVSITSSTEIYELQSSVTNPPVLFDPRSLDFTLAELEDLSGGDATRNAEIIREILDGKAADAQRDVVVINAAFGIHVSGIADSLEMAVKLAKDSIKSGSAKKKLEQFAEATQDAAS